MSDEVKQAAERLRLGRYSSLDDLDEYYMSSRKFEDMEILSGAYLHEHDSETEKDNATLLTSEILQASGWERPSGWATLWANSTGPTVYCSTDGLSVEINVDNKWYDIETVGDLRKLLEALHITAVVVVPKGGE